MILSEYLDIDVAKGNKKHYINLGYNCKVGDTLKVKYTDVPKCSSIRILIECDYCGKKYDTSISTYNRSIKGSIINKHACKNCVGKKGQESNLIKYGEISPNKLDSVKEKVKKTNCEKYGCHPSKLNITKDKRKETNLQKYGVESVSQLDYIKEKIKSSNLQKYGVESTSQLESVKNKVRNTNFQRYGVENAFQNKEVQNKQKQTCLNKYGVENTFQVEEFKEKSNKTMIGKYGATHFMKIPEKKKEIMEKIIMTKSNNGTIATSKQQLHIHKLIGGSLNYPVNNLSLDIAFPDDMIYLEYNGGGHDLQVKLGVMSQEEFKRKELNRYFFLKRLGWKQIVLESPKDKLPSDDIIIELINNSISDLKNSKTYSHIIIDFENLNTDIKNTSTI